MKRIFIALFVTLVAATSAQTSPAVGANNPFYAMDTSFQRPGLTESQQLDLVKQLGYAGIAWHEEAPEKVKAVVADVERRGLKMHAIYCAAQVDAKGELTCSPQLPKLIEVLDGHGTIVWLHLGGPGPAFDRLTGLEPLVQKLRSLAELAAAHGLKIAIYPHFGEWTARFGDATRLAKLVDRPALGVSFNLCHCLAAGDERIIAQLLVEARPVLVTVTICGADSGVVGPQWNRLIQTLDRGAFDVGAVVRQLRKAGFVGPIGFQGYGIQADASNILTPTIAAWKRLAAEEPQKSLPLPGEVFRVQGRQAFVILPDAKVANKPLPWVWYAPTLPGLPAGEEKWMFERFTRAGIAIAGIDVGESFGSPDGRALYSALYNELTGKRGFAPKAVMLGRSRGGLMTLSWAAENADKVAGFAGIYPVCNLASYPGVANASGAYHLSAKELSARLAEHNPIDRLGPLAKAGVPFFAIHGDKDETVPLDLNSGEMRKRYKALGGRMQLIVPAGQGHNMWTGFFQCQELVDFVLAHARQAQGNSLSATRLSQFLAVALSPRQPAIESLAVDSLGRGKCSDNALHPPPASAVAFKSRPTACGIEYRRSSTPDDVAAGWTIEATDRAIRLLSQYSANEQPGPVVCNFDTTRCHATLLGLFQSVARKDYAHKEPRFGGGLRADNADGFQRYENGGATACFAYFTLAALYDLGRREEADRMLMPMLQAFEDGKFEGKGANGLSNDWRAWDGTAWGYEGFLVDNYYTLLAVLARDNAAKK